MMSAEKSEIRKLNTVVDETVKVIKGLKTELYSRKLSQCFTGEETHVLDVSSSNKSQKTSRSADGRKVSGQIPSREGDCASSVLTKELQDFKMTELVTELKLELQKLPWSMGEASSADESKVVKADSIVPFDNIFPITCSSVENIPFLYQMGTGASGERIHEQADESLGLHYSNGVLPHLLKQKLSHVLIEQQENHRRLSNISLSAVSDEEEDVDARLGDLREDKDDDDVVGSELSKSPGVVVGMKRPTLQL